MGSQAAGVVSGDLGDGAAAVVVVGYVLSGSGVFRAVMDVPGGPVWLDVPGLVQTVYQVGSLWQRLEGRGDRVSAVSPLVRKGVRAMLQGMLISRLAREGGRCWAAAAHPSPVAALEFFAEVHSEARFVCLHRSFDDFASAAMSRFWWESAGSGTALDNFMARYPRNPVAALADYWVAQTKALLAFEEAHRDRCLRVHYADLVAHPEEAVREFRLFTAWELRTSSPGWLDDAVPAAPPPAEIPVPRERIPGELLAEIGSLMAELGYQDRSAESVSTANS